MASATLSSLGLEVNQIAQNVRASSARAYLNALYPEEFEYYLCSLELMDSSGYMDEMLIFPVMPNSIQEVRQSLVNVKKTTSSVVSLTNNTFAPTSISISGTFGRKLRILLGPKQTTNSSAFYFENNISIRSQNVELNTEIKTGYGVTKKMEKMIKKSQKEGYLLFFYNFALGNNYLVEVTDMTFQQSMENNMLWNYSVNMKSLANAESVRPGGKDEYDKAIKEMLKYDNINKAIFSITETMKGLKFAVNEAIDTIF